MHFPIASLLVVEQKSYEQATRSHPTIFLFIKQREIVMKTPASSGKQVSWMYFLLPVCILLSLIIAGALPLSRADAASTSTAEQAFTQASQETGVPTAILKAICQMEGNLSMHGGAPSVSEGYGCMNLIHTDTDGCKAMLENKGDTCTHHFTRRQIDTLGQAAQLLHVSSEQIKTDFATNIRAGAWILRTQALALSSAHTLPTQLADWYGAVASYSNATIPSTSSMYADAVFKLLQIGFTATTDQGESVT